MATTIINTTPAAEVRADLMRYLKTVVLDEERIMAAEQAAAAVAEIAPT